MKNLNGNDIFASAKYIAYCAIMTALLIGGQVALGFVAGIEVVTVLLLSFSFVFGIVCGVTTAIAFSLLRCFIWGFYPTVIVLYLIYYPIFALIFAVLGKILKFDSQPKKGVTACTRVILLMISALCFIAIAFDLIKISIFYKTTTTVLLAVIGSISFLLFGATAFVDVRFKDDEKRKNNLGVILFVTAVATVCTICFTLLDDVISPLMLGMGENSSLAYFYASFTAMLPQTLCTILTTTTLFYPLTRIMRKFK